MNEVRTSFFKALFGVAKADPRVILLTADMGFNLLERFRDELPTQYVNSGISEANTMSMAAGMALAGKKPFVYSITPFVTYRCLEQIRVDICYHNIGVKIVGVGSGLDYAQSGSTHQPTEDISIMRSMPNMQVVCPSDSLEAATLPAAICNLKSPVFVRLGRGKEPAIYSQPPKMQVGKGIPIFSSKGSGKRIAILATGNIVYNAYLAAKQIASGDIPVDIFSVPWIKPLDERLVLEQAQSSNLLVTIEEHSEIGGLRSAVCETLSKNGVCANFRYISLPDAFQKTVGDQEYLRKLNGLDAKSIASRISDWASRL